MNAPGDSFSLAVKKREQYNVSQQKRILARRLPASLRAEGLDEKKCKGREVSEGWRVEAQAPFPFHRRTPDPAPLPPSAPQLTLIPRPSSRTPSRSFAAR